MVWYTENQSDNKFSIMVAAVPIPLFTSSPLIGLTD